MGMCFWSVEIWDLHLGFGLHMCCINALRVEFGNLLFAFRARIGAFLDLCSIPDAVIEIIMDNVCLARLSAALHYCTNDLLKAPIGQ
jgi:hypothetical protein